MYRKTDLMVDKVFVFSTYFMRDCILPTFCKKTEPKVWKDESCIFYLYVDTKSYLVYEQK